MSRRARRVAAKPWARARAERPSVRILVVVANIQMRTLKAEEGKRFHVNALAHGLVDPKRRGKPSDSAFRASFERESG
ncbi:hypothetical protein LguiA_035807 [Lonicera macranthoides]